MIGDNSEDQGRIKKQNVLLPYQNLVCSGDSKNSVTYDKDGDCEMTKEYVSSNSEGSPRNQVQIPVSVTSVAAQGGQKRASSSLLVSAVDQV